jgi:hypothetical protein
MSEPVLPIIYFIESSISFKSDFSGAYWIEGHVGFIQANAFLNRQQLENHIDSVETLTHKESGDHMQQIQGTFTERAFIGILNGVHSYDTIRKATSLDVIYHNANNCFRNNSKFTGQVIDNNVEKKALFMYLGELKTLIYDNTKKQFIIDQTMKAEEELCENDENEHDSS